LELYLLRSFLAVAEARSFTGAARAVHATQSTLSRQIARLESELGVQLFERYGRHVECTATGELLLPLVQAIVTRVDEVTSLARERAGPASNTVRFGAVPNVLALLLAPILVSFLAAHPSMSVHLLEMDDAQLEEAVVTGELDCAVMTPWGSARVATQRLASEEILLVVPRGHHLANHPAISFNALANEPILLPRPTLNLANTFVNAMRRAGFEPRSSYRCNYPELNKALVREGVGVAPMPKLLVAPESMEGLVAIPFKEPLFRELCLAYPRDRRLPAGTQALMRYVKANVSERGGTV
jgi:LysR family transcriptional regulator, transcription activator of glutamate synthase operon